MEDNTEEIPVLMPGQGAFTREVLRRCVLAACSERETDGELTERAIEGIVDIVLDCEDGTSMAQLWVRPQVDGRSAPERRAAIVHAGLRRLAVSHR